MTSSSPNRDHNRTGRQAMNLYGAVRPCYICGDEEPFHIHDEGRRIDDYSLIGRYEEDIAAARHWQDRALTAEKLLQDRDICGEPSPEAGVLCTLPPGHSPGHRGPDLAYPPQEGRHSIWAVWA